MFQIMHHWCWVAKACQSRTWHRHLTSRAKQLGTDEDGSWRDMTCHQLWFSIHLCSVCCSFGWLPNFSHWQHLNLHMFLQTLFVALVSFCKWHAVLSTTMAPDHGHRTRTPDVNMEFIIIEAYRPAFAHWFVCRSRLTDMSCQGGGKPILFWTDRLHTVIVSLAESQWKTSAGFPIMGVIYFIFLWLCCWALFKSVGTRTNVVSCIAWLSCNATIWIWDQRNACRNLQLFKLYCFDAAQRVVDAIDIE